MTEQLTTKEYLTLQHLVNVKDHDKAPVSLTDAQYYSALKSLKDKNMVYAAFVEGDEVYAAQIRPNGQAIIDDLSDEADHIIRKLIKKENLTDEQFRLLKFASDNDGAKNIFDVSNDIYKKEIWSPLIGRGYLKVDRSKNAIVITPLGISFLTQIDKDLAYEITTKANTKDINPNNSSNTSTNQEDNVQELSCIKINEEYRKQIIKDIITANSYGYFKDKNGNMLNDKQIIDAFAQFFNDEKMREYAFSAEDIKVEDEELVKDLLPLFYNNITSTNSFLEKIKVTKSNTEITRIAADFVNSRELSDYSCRKTLWTILNKYELYPKSLNNWYRTIKNFIK